MTCANSRRTPGSSRSRSNIYTANADGSGVRQVTHDRDDEDPTWGSIPLPVSRGNGRVDRAGDPTSRVPNGLIGWVDG